MLFYCRSVTTRGFAGNLGRPGDMFIPQRRNLWEQRNDKKWLGKVIHVVFVQFEVVSKCPDGIFPVIPVGVAGRI